MLFSYVAICINFNENFVFSRWLFDLDPVCGTLPCDSFAVEAEQQRHCFGADIREVARATGCIFRARWKPT